MVQTLAPGSEAAARERARVRLSLEQEETKPAGQRDEKRLLALRKEDSQLNRGYLVVRDDEGRQGCVWERWFGVCPLPSRCGSGSSPAAPAVFKTLKLSTHARLQTQIQAVFSEGMSSWPSRVGMTGAAAAGPALECMGERRRHTKLLPACFHDCSGRLRR